MTVALDSNILLDLIYTDAPDHKMSRNAVRTATASDQLIIAEPVIAEVASAFGAETEFARFLSRLEISAVPSSAIALRSAGLAFRQYLANRGNLRCAACGSPIAATCPNCGTQFTGRQHVLPDFMIGAHALVHAGRLLTRDRGYYARYFPELVLV